MERKLNLFMMYPCSNAAPKQVHGLIDGKDVVMSPFVGDAPTVLLQGKERAWVHRLGDSRDFQLLLHHAMHAEIPFPEGCTYLVGGCSDRALIGILDSWTRVHCARK